MRNPLTAAVVNVFSYSSSSGKPSVGPCDGYAGAESDAASADCGKAASRAEEIPSPC